MLEFFSMGGYAAYVWSAFGFSLVTMIVLYVMSVSNARKSSAEFEAVKAELRPRRGGSSPRSRQAMRAQRASDNNTAESTGG